MSRTPLLRLRSCCQLLAAVLVLASGAAVAWGGPTGGGGDGAPGVRAPDDHPAVVAARRPDAQIGRPTDGRGPGLPPAALAAPTVEPPPPAARRAAHVSFPPQGTGPSIVSSRSTRGPPGDGR